MFLEHCKIPPKYIVLFKGDDSDFDGNQEIAIDIDTQLSLEGVKAHFRFLDFSQDFDAIPEDRRLLLVFPRESTRKLPLGAMDATLTFEDAQGRTRTVANRIHIVVTNSVGEAYWNEDPQAITVVMSGDEYLKNAEVSEDGKTLTITKKDGTEVQFRGGGGGGTGDYNELENKPSINGKTMIGDKSSSQLGLQDALTDDQKEVLDGGPYVNSDGVIKNYTAQIVSEIGVSSTDSAGIESSIRFTTGNGPAQSTVSVKDYDSEEERTFVFPLKSGGRFTTEDQLRITMQLVGNDPYTVQVDGEELTFAEIKTYAQTRNAVIQRGQGTYRVTYIGANEMMWDVTGTVQGEVKTGQIHIFDQNGVTVVQRVEPKVLATKPMIDEIKETVSTDNRFLVGGSYSESPVEGSPTTAAIQTHDAETDKWTDEIRIDKAYDAVSGGSAMVKLDKSVQNITVASESLSIVLPEETRGTVRDLCLYVNNNSGADCALVFPNGTYYGDNPNGAVAKDGSVTAVYITEMPVGSWMLRISELEQFKVEATT